MSTGYAIDDQYATYFLTPTIVDWVDVFTRKNYRDIIIDSLNYCIKEKSLKLYGYVVMTNHLHLIARSENGTLSDTLRDFKKFTARATLEAIRNEPESRREWMLHRFEWNATQNKRSSDNQVWTHENHPEIIYSLKFFNQKLNYIHDNPVRAGWVENQIFNHPVTGNWHDFFIAIFFANMHLSELDLQKIELSTDCISGYDADLNIIIWNSAVAQKYLVSKEAAMGKNLFELFPHVRNDYRIQCLKEVLLEGNEFYFAGIPHDNDPGIYSQLMFPIKYDDSRTALNIVRDHSHYESILKKDLLFPIKKR